MRLYELFSRADALYQEYLTKCSIKIEDQEILALTMKELPKDLKYQLSFLKGSSNGMRSWHWSKTKLGHFTETFNQDMQQI